MMSISCQPPLLHRSFTGFNCRRGPSCEPRTLSTPRCGVEHLTTGPTSRHAALYSILWPALQKDSPLNGRFPIQFKSLAVDMSTPSVPIYVRLEYKSAPSFCRARVTATYLLSQLKHSVQHIHVELPSTQLQTWLGYCVRCLGGEKVSLVSVENHLHDIPIVLQSPPTGHTR